MAVKKIDPVEPSDELFAALREWHCCVERSDDRVTGDLPVRHVRAAPSRPV